MGMNVPALLQTPVYPTSDQDPTSEESTPAILTYEQKFHCLPRETDPREQLHFSQQNHVAALHTAHITGSGLGTNEQLQQHDEMFTQMKTMSLPNCSCMSS